MKTQLLSPRLVTFYKTWNREHPMEKVALMNEFTEAAVSPLHWLESYLQKSHQRAIGYMCSYTPVELIRAAGFLPVKIFGLESPPSIVDAHLQNYCCHVVKNALGQMLENKWNALHGVIFCHTCDSMQCLSDIWNIHTKMPFHHTFNIPTQFSSKASCEYLVAELYQLKIALEEAAGQKIDTDSIEQGCSIYHESRMLFKQLVHLRMNDPAVISRAELNNIICASHIMPPELFNDLMEKLCACFFTEKDNSSNNRKRVYLTGSVCYDPRIYQIIENESNGIIVDDDLCNGSRLFDDPFDTAGDPVLRLANNILRRRPCPCKQHYHENRADMLIGEVLKSKADGVIFYLHKFCDPHFFDYPHLKNSLSEHNIPSILIEVEKPGYNIGQIKNRLHAFLESMEHA